MVYINRMLVRMLSALAPFISGIEQSRQGKSHQPHGPRGSRGASARRLPRSIARQRGPSAHAWGAVACSFAALLPLAVRATGTHSGHQFSVTETGAVTISIPIQVPRGIGGMEPQLSLNYSTGAGNGLLGIGWTLAGPSSITRCPKSKVHDGVRGVVDFTTADRYCLDGQRLVSVNATTDSTYGAPSTEYRTERDSISRIRSVGTLGSGSLAHPANFEVYTKAGLVLEFGIGDNSRAMTVMADGSTAVVSRWLLQRISDRMLPTPNFVEFVYCGGEVSAAYACGGTYTGSKVLHYIQYTNRTGLNGTTAVLFGYEARPDRQLQYHAGAMQVQTQRLAHISTHLGFSPPASPVSAPASLGTWVKIYELTYDPMTDSTGAWTRVTNTSRLTRIQEVRGALGPLTRPPPLSRGVADALPPLDFVYATDMVYGKAISQTITPGATALPPPLSCGGYVGAYRANQICP